MVELSYDFNRSIGYHVHMTARTYQKALSQELAAHGITLPQFVVVLSLIHWGEGLIQAELADLLRVEGPSLARLLDRMEAAGWVERRASPSDRRAKRIFFGPKAKELWPLMRECALDINATARQGVGEEEIAQCLRTLERIRQNLTGRVEPEAPLERKEGRRLGVASSL
ncbi:MAG: MarR family winged helix-turn-helix transcriptional regulator [Nitrospinota bacterium]